MKIIGFSTVFIADMNSACKNTLISIFLQNLQVRHNYLQFYRKADFLKNLKMSNFGFIFLLFHLKTYFLTFSDILLKSFSENHKKLTEITKIIHFSIFFFFCIFQENRRNLNSFHRRYEFCMQKFPTKHIFIEFAGKA